MLGLVRVMSSLLAERREQKCHFRVKLKGLKSRSRAAGWELTRGTKAESAGGAQTAASDTDWMVFVPRAGLILAGWHHQADVGVQLDQQAALEHPHHHLDQLSLISRVKQMKVILLST